MPEGDSLRHAQAALRPVLIGQALSAVYDHGLARAAFAGSCVRSVEARGKHLLIEVEDANTIHLHFRMNGRMWIERRDAVAVTRLRAASLALLTEAHVVLFTRVPVVEFLRTAFVHAHPALARLGPDLCDELEDFEPVLAEIVHRARAPELADRPIADVLLDQRVAAGIGNVYKSEVLFVERQDPFALVRALDDAVLARLYRRARLLLRMNLGTGPRTTTADRSRFEVPRAGQGRFWVYDRRGRACYRCGRPIASRLLGEGARNTFYCQTCQRPAGR